MYRYDATQHLTEVRPPVVGGEAWASTTFTYDEGGNLAGMTDARNHTVSFGHDDNGNRVLEQDALGNSVVRTFSAHSELLTETR